MLFIPRPKSMNMCVYICAWDTMQTFLENENHATKSQKEMQKIFKQPSNKLTSKRPTMLSVDKILWEHKSVQPLWKQFDITH